jgi:hypothetical protein
MRLTMKIGHTHVATQPLIRRDGLHVTGVVVEATLKKDAGKRLALA